MFNYINTPNSPSYNDQLLAYCNTIICKTGYYSITDLNNITGSIENTSVIIQYWLKYNYINYINRNKTEFELTSYGQVRSFHTALQLQ